MKRLVLAAAMLSALAAPCAQAETAKAEHEWTVNGAVTTDYRYRGISQSRLLPALQGGADYTHNPSGFYAGVWASTIRWTRDAGGRGALEADLYAGKRGELAAGVSYDIGVLAYVYPSNGMARVAGFANANTTEVYGQLGYGPAYVKYSHSVTNLFGFVDSKGSGYLDLGANVELSSGLTLNLHAGHQRVAHAPAAKYNDFKVGVTRDFGQFTGAVALIGTDAQESAYASPYNGKFLGRAGLVVTVAKVF
ncbi:MAG TPA: TorF family putative porin [Burkholderiaceae bacterium]